MKKALRFFLFISFAVILVSLDQWTKHLAIQYLKGGREIYLIPHVLSLLYVENPGAAFGILHGQQGFFLLITIAVLLGILYVLYKLPENFKIRSKNASGSLLKKERGAKTYYPLFLALSLVFSGAIGNLVDMYVTCASFLLLYLLGFYYGDEDMHFLKWGKNKD